MCKITFSKGDCILNSLEVCFLTRLEDKNSTFSFTYLSAFPHFSLCVSTEIVVIFPPPLWLNLQSSQILFSNWHMPLNFYFHHLPTKYIYFFFSFSGLNATFTLRLEFYCEKQTESDRNRPLETLLPPFLLFCVHSGEFILLVWYKLYKRLKLFFLLKVRRYVSY